MRQKHRHMSTQTQQQKISKMKRLVRLSVTPQGELKQLVLQQLY